MQITAEYLIEIRQRAEQQKLRLLAEAQQAVGAIAMLDVMIARLNEPETQRDNPVNEPGTEANS